ncbi:hypothetical protein CPC16_001061 [Podila verticillata]|nr:hypothetical protein CPC16_001061 [Podila verticillata]KAI9240950.1 MAG: hypothetical protein BYD32DRAFT_407085 [Podila humilis]
MLIKTLLVLVAMAAPALAYEPVTCTPINSTRSIIASIDDANDFCTFMTGYGVNPVAPNEGCAGVYCQGKVKNGAQAMPAGYILSSNYAKNTSYVQVTGCIDSSVWAQNPQDEGGQMDSHGWPYSCQGWAKFVSLIEPATNTFCIRCCDADNNVDCNTSISTKGCWNVVPGLYTMADGSACKPPANMTTTPTSTTSGVPTSSATPITSSGGAGIPTPISGSGSGSGSGTGSSAGSRVSVSIEMVGAVAAVALALAASF